MGEQGETRLNILHLVQSIGRKSAGLGGVATALPHEQEMLGCQTKI